MSKKRAMDGTFVKQELDTVAKYNSKKQCNEKTIKVCCIMDHFDHFYNCNEFLIKNKNIFNIKQESNQRKKINLKNDNNLNNTKNKIFKDHNNHNSHHLNDSSFDEKNQPSNVCPLSTLTPATKNKNIVVKILFKKIKTIKQDKKMIELILMDVKGSVMKCVIWNDYIDKVANIIVGDSIQMQNFVVNFTDARFMVFAKYQIMLTGATLINILRTEFAKHYCQPIYKYNHKIKDLPNCTSTEFIDIVGIISSDFNEIMVNKKNNVTVKKTDFSMIDETGTVSIVIWNDADINFLKTGDIISIAKAKISRFNDSISLTVHGWIEKNPKNAQSMKLKNFFSKSPKTMNELTNDLPCLTIKTETIPSKEAFKYFSCDDIKEIAENYKNFQTFPTNKFIKTKGILVRMVSSKYYFEKQQTFEKKYRVQYQVKDVIDGSKMIKVIFYQQAEKLFEMSVEELCKLQENEPTAFLTIFETITEEALPLDLYLKVQENKLFQKLDFHF